MFTKSQHFGFVVTSGVSRETSMIFWRVLVQQQLKHRNMLWLSDGLKRRNVSPTSCLAWHGKNATYVGQWRSERFCDKNKLWSQKRGGLEATLGRSVGRIPPFRIPLWGTAKQLCMDTLYIYIYIYIHIHVYMCITHMYVCVCMYIYIYICYNTYDAYTLQVLQGRGFYRRSQHAKQKG